MTRYCALLRGIGPSDPNMRNDRLRGVFQGLGFTEVASVLASGNIVFADPSGEPAPVLERRIQEALHAQLGIPGGTLVRSREELQHLMDREPFGARTHGKSTYLSVTFCKDPLDPVPEPFPAPPSPEVDVLGYDAHCRAVLAVVDTTGTRTPDFMGWLQREFGTGITTRTWLTVTRILRKFPSG